MPYWQRGNGNPPCLSPATFFQALLLPINPKLSLQQGVRSFLAENMHRNTLTMFPLWTYSLEKMSPERETLQPKEKKGMSISCSPARLWALGELHLYGKSSPPKHGSMSWVLGSRVGGGEGVRQRCQITCSSQATGKLWSSDMNTRDWKR